jgi:hypothetical protein
VDEAGEAWDDRGVAKINANHTIGDDGLRPPNRSDPQAPLSTEWSNMDSSAIRYIQS